MPRGPEASSTAGDDGVDSAHITRLVTLSGMGGEAGRISTEALYPIVYDELRRLAGGLLHQERGPLTLQPTALVNEAYLRLLGKEGQTLAWESRAHFFGAAARAMRCILIDRARSARVARRDRAGVTGLHAQAPGPTNNPTDQAPHSDHADDLLALDQALDELRQRDPRQHEVVMLRYFAGLSLEQTAQLLGTSMSTVKNDWSFARAWLLRRMSERGRAGAWPGPAEG